MNNNVKKGDTVLVLAGKEKGKTAEVLECFPRENKVTVKGLNMIVKHNKPRSAQDKGGIVKKEGKLDASNVMVVCSSCNKATRTKVGADEKGKKVRLCSHCGANLDSTKKVATKKTEKKEVATENAEVKAEAKKETTAKKPAAKKVTQNHETNSVKTTKSASTVARKSASTAKKIGGK